MINKRIIGRYTGDRRGPLLFIFGAMHGNETAGVHALDLLFKMLEVEPITNPKFSFKGRVLGLTGNMAAFKAGKRFIDQDLNRCWTIECIDKAFHANKNSEVSEFSEIRSVIRIIRREIEDYKPKKMAFLDLHTFSTTGGVFVLTPEDHESIIAGIELGIPVITGFTKGLHGTSVEYFNEENLGLPTVSLSFECGQHKDPLSINRAIAAMINCMKVVGCIGEEHIENQHNDLLVEHSKNAPKLSRLLLKHLIKPGDGFVMEPGFTNFQPVAKGTLLAKDIRGPIYAPFDGMILMPLYQSLGEEGFFIVEPYEINS
ncbi:MAG TPA: hypothetical protein DCX89_09400 [Saprospirales bacterium]|nr:hypothetical protein [Saprospirales bacterium]HRQ29208.1 succinylglutamate desuccinylase/aspartoacylase family protein [Saprospiraceae bacterium]